jgi:DNA phosphorothioation-dependent restriction protein DptG
VDWLGTPMEKSKTSDSWTMDSHIAVCHYWKANERNHQDWHISREGTGCLHSILSTSHALFLHASGVQETHLCKHFPHSFHERVVG